MPCRPSTILLLLLGAGILLLFRELRNTPPAPSIYDHDDHDENGDYDKHGGYSHAPGVGLLGRGRLGHGARSLHGCTAFGIASDSGAWLSTNSQTTYSSLLEPVPTTHGHSVPGYTLFNNIYTRYGKFYVISDAIEEALAVGDVATGEFPPIEAIMSLPPDDVTGKREPATKNQLEIIPRRMARELLGEQAVLVGGSTIYLNDQASGPPRNMGSFIDHYFHLVAELFIGAWRLLAHVHASENGIDSARGMDYPARLIIAHERKWRDHAGLSSWFLQTVLPMTAIEESTIWSDRAKSGVTNRFERLVIVDRFSAGRKSIECRAWNKMAAELPNVSAPADWWSPIRDNLLRGTGSADLLGAREKGIKPVVTYVSRQKAGHRALFNDDHDQVLASFEELHQEGDIEFVHALMENMNRAEQFRLAARTDILLGIHGNGLSHQMWQRPQSDVVEIMDIGGFTRDYEILSELMDHDHHTVHNDTKFFRSQWFQPNGKIVEQTKDFHQTNIRVHGPFLVQLVRDIVKRKYS